MITLYDYDLSVNCYKQRLLMAILGVEYRSVPVDFFPGREHKGEAFRAINPLGHIPVLVDDTDVAADVDSRGEPFVIRDAHAILVYLAARYDPAGRWYPTDDPRVLGEVAQWMAFAEGTTNTASAARLHDNLGPMAGYEFDIEDCRAGAHELFRVLDEHLWFNERQGRDWICSPADPTIADLAVFPDVMLSEEGGISRLPYPALRRWTDRVRRLDGFVPMPGIHPAGPALPADDPSTTASH